MYLVLTREFIICISTYQLFFSFSWVLWSSLQHIWPYPLPQLLASTPSFTHLCVPLLRPMKPVLCCSHVLGCVASHWSVADVTRSHRWYHLPVAQLGGGGERLSLPPLSTMVLALAWASHTGRAHIVTVALSSNGQLLCWPQKTQFPGLHPPLLIFRPPLPPWSLGCGKRGHYTLDFKSTLIKSMKSSETELSTLIWLPFSFLLYNINLSTSFKPSSIVP